MDEEKVPKYKIKITSKPVKAGSGYYFLIPKPYIRDGNIDLKKKYVLYIDESDEED